jgi:hypothetical protein
MVPGKTPHQLMPTEVATRTWGTLTLVAKRSDGVEFFVRIVPTLADPPTATLIPLPPHRASDVTHGWATLDTFRDCACTADVQCDWHAEYLPRHEHGTGPGRVLTPKGVTPVGGGRRGDQ